MKKVFSFKVSANKNIGGRREIERYEDEILTRIVSGKGERDERVRLLRDSTEKFFRSGGKAQNKEFEVLEIFSDVSWTDVTPKDRKHKQYINGKNVSVVNIGFPNAKVIEKGESVTILSECSPSSASIEKAFQEQLGKKTKGNLSTDFFTIIKV
jgi:hypothetical protein